MYVCTGTCISIIKQQMSTQNNTDSHHPKPLHLNQNKANTNQPTDQPRRGFQREYVATATTTTTIRYTKMPRSESIVFCGWFF